jgi:DNA transposition AAA+ family ATPase
MSDKKECNEALRLRLQEHKDRDNLKLRDLASEIGRSDSSISRYLAGKPEGDVGELEGRIDDYLRNAAKRRIIDIPAFETPATVMFAAVAEQIRKTGDVGLITGPAGIGKTKAIELYSAANTTSLHVTLCRWIRSDSALMRRLWEQIDTRGWSASHCSKASFLEQRLTGSKRLIIVDNAHRAQRSALQFLFDMHDATGCPIALVGNPEVLGNIKGNDQMFSRVGIFKDLATIGRKNRTMDDWMKTAARKLLEALMPAADGAVIAMAEEAALEPGHLRTLKKQSILAADLLQTSKFKDRPADAFCEAGNLLVRKTRGDEED